MRDEALTKAIAVLGGNVSRLAGAIGVKPQAIYQWGRVPTQRVLAVEAATGVSRHELRPDVYGPSPQPTTATGGDRAAPASAAAGGS